MTRGRTNYWESELYNVGPEPELDGWQKTKGQILRVVQIAAGVLFFTAIIVGTVIGSIRAHDKRVDEFRNICEDKLNSEFISEPEFMCVRNGDIVYREDD